MSQVKDFLDIMQAQQKSFAEAKRLFLDRLAPDFSPFEFIKHNEMQLSVVLAWLMNPHGSHGQGSLFLKLFLKRLGVGWPLTACDKSNCQNRMPI